MKLISLLIIAIYSAIEQVTTNNYELVDLFSDSQYNSIEAKITRELASLKIPSKYGIDTGFYGPGLTVEKAFFQDFPVSVAVSKTGRKFVSFPHWEQNKGRSLIELINSHEILYPSNSMNDVNNTEGFANIHALFIDDLDRLWVLDTGRVTNNVRPVRSTKFFVYNLRKNSLERVYTFSKDVEFSNSQLQDIRFDPGMKFGFITDASVPGIAVLNLETGESFRRLNNHTSTTAVDNFGLTIEGKIVKINSAPTKIHSNGIATSLDRKIIYYSSVSSRSLYSIPAAALSDKSLSNAEVAAMVKVEVSDKGSATSGLLTGPDGSIYMCNLEHNSITKFNPNTKSIELVVRHPALLWPDTLAYFNKRLYVTSNQINRRASFNNGTDARKSPYFLFSFPI